MSISKAKVGEYNGKDVYAYTLCGKDGLCAEILTYGGIIQKLIYKDVDVVLGRDRLEDYFENEEYFGALIGRNSNRIANASFVLGDKCYTLAQNDGRNNLHGGLLGFDKKVWDAQVIDSEEPALLLSITSPDDEEGFPGTAHVQVQYTIKNDNSFEIHYMGECDQDTILNLTNHSYFNLNGHASGTVEQHSLYLASDFYTPNTSECIPTGEILSVKDTPFDFTIPSCLSERLRSEHVQIRNFGGFDHNFVLRGRGYREVGSFIGDKSGITMKIYTDQSGIQFYSGNMIKKGKVCKGDAVYDRYSGVCFETQAFPNSPKFSHFSNVVLRKGEKYETVTAYKFI